MICQWIYIYDVLYTVQFLNMDLSDLMCWLIDWFLSIVYRVTN